MRWATETVWLIAFNERDLFYIADIIDIKNTIIEHNENKHIQNINIIIDIRSAIILKILLKANVIEGKNNGR